MKQHRRKDKWITASAGIGLLLRLKSQNSFSKLPVPKIGSGIDLISNYVCH
jgi:hypothetical protein